MKTNTTETVRAFVKKSVDPKWPRWAAVIPGIETEWFKTEAEAKSKAHDFNTQQEKALRG